MNDSPTRGGDQDAPDGTFPDAWLAYLRDNAILYRLLSEAEQARLRDLVPRFIAGKFWEGCAGLRVTDEMKVAVAGQACLLLLGWDDYCFEELKTILLYPGAYLGVVPDELGGEDLVAPRLGEAHRDGPVVLSWRNVLRDGRRPGEQNLVLHEFAHKLAEQGDFFLGLPPVEDTEQAERWKGALRAEFHRLRREIAEGRPTLLRPYGAVNRPEFFAVATECFFLHPAALRERHGALYDLLAGWYRQDPAARPAAAAVVAAEEDTKDEEAHRDIAEWSAVIRRRPEYAAAYPERAEWYRHLRELDKALADYTAAIALLSGQERAAAHYGRGVVHLEAKAPDAAIADFNEAIRHCPDFACAYRERGAAHAARGDREQALADLNRALRLDPRDDRAHVERGWVHYKAGTYGKALRDLTRALALAPEARTYCDRAAVRLAQEECEQAVADCDEALRLDPGLALAYVYRGQAHHYRGARDLALADFDAALRLDPNDSEAKRWREDLS
jgi:Mlc titration factor MtfA (ptsG expression regulator)/Tfp pilus assembly protein PilF